MAFGKLCESELAKSVNGRLPFTVMFIGGAVSLFGSTVDQLRAQSKRFREKEDAINQARLTAYGEEHVNWRHNIDVPPGCSHYVLVDGLTKGSIDFGGEFCHMHSSSTPNRPTSRVLYMIIDAHYTQESEQQKSAVMKASHVLVGAVNAEHDTERPEDRELREAGEAGE